jgi:hypothetical protein
MAAHGNCNYRSLTHLGAAYKDMCCAMRTSPVPCPCPGAVPGPCPEGGVPALVAVCPSSGPGAGPGLGPCASLSPGSVSVPVPVLVQLES